MKILYLIRHAKSSWEHQVEDHRRPLKKRGLKDAALVSKHLKSSFVKPNLILSSDAERAKQTAHIFVENLDLASCPFELDNCLYDFSGQDLLEVIQACDNNIDKLMIFGHNYALTNFVNSYGDRAIENVTTSGFVELHFDVSSWRLLKRGVTVRTLFPKDLK